MQIEEILNNFRSRLHRDDYPTQEELNEIATELSALNEIIPGEPIIEQLQLMNSNGSPMDLFAPRWLCHLIGLRHGCSHVLLFWQSPVLGRVLVLQVRSWKKKHAPGQVDISVGGHVKAGQSSEYTAFLEMKEELGLDLSNLKGESIYHMMGYENFNENPEEHFYNAEWRDIYVAEIDTEQLGRVHFKDKEVACLFFCPEREAENLLQQKYIPITGALRLSLPHCLTHPLMKL